MQKTKIAIQMPGRIDPKRIFSVILKKELTKMSTSFRAGNKIFIIGNISGDFKVLRRILVKNNIINTKHEWLFEDGHLVILGNCFKEETLECLWLIYSLEEKAEKVGGFVHFIIGKKEIENLNGDWSNLHPRYAVRSSKIGSRLCVLYDGNRELYRWLKTKSPMVIIGDSIFAQGNISPCDLQQGKQGKIDEILKVFVVKRIIVGYLDVPGVISTSDEKVINVCTMSGKEHSKALFICSGILYIADSDGNKEKFT